MKDETNEKIKRNGNYMKLTAKSGSWSRVRRNEKLNHIRGRLTLKFLAC